LERELVIPSSLICINEVRVFLDGVFKESSLDRVHFNRVFLGLSEAVNNSIVHGNRYNSNKKVFVSVLFSERKLFIEVKDQGEGFSVDCIEEPTCLNNLKNENGRGIFLMRQVADEVIFSNGGRCVLIIFNFD
jgi:serine/threonine-protein kinase RsbW